MSKAKMERARDLIKAKRYDQARAILESVDHPTARKWLTKIDEIAPIDEPDWEALQNEPPPRRTLYIGFGVIGVVIVLAILVVFVIVSRPSQEDLVAATAQAAGATVIAGNATVEAIDEEIKALLAPSYRVYCESLDRSRGDCSRWMDAVFAERLEEATACYQEYDSIFDKGNFSWCLAAVGIAAVGDNPIIEPLDMDTITSLDQQGIVAVKGFCEFRRDNEDFCDIWSLLTYLQNSAIVQGCLSSASGGPLSSGVDRCMGSNGLPIP